MKATSIGNKEKAEIITEARYIIDDALELLAYVEDHQQEKDENLNEIYFKIADQRYNLKLIADAIELSIA